MTQYIYENIRIQHQQWKIYNMMLYKTSSLVTECYSLVESEVSIQYNGTKIKLA